jgi:hypothetical protein
MRARNLLVSLLAFGALALSAPAEAGFKGGGGGAAGFKGGGGGHAGHGGFARFGKGGGHGHIGHKSFGPGGQLPVPHGRAHLATHPAAGALLHHTRPHVVHGPVDHHRKLGKHGLFHQAHFKRFHKSKFYGDGFFYPLGVPGYGYDAAYAYPYPVYVPVQAVAAVPAPAPDCDPKDAGCVKGLGHVRGRGPVTKTVRGVRVHYLMR